MRSLIAQRRAWRSLVAVVSAAATLLACQSTTAPTNPGSPTVKLDISPATGTDSALSKTPAVTVAPGMVTVTGYLTTPYTCYDVAAAEQILDGTLVVRIAATKHAPSCAAALATFRYAATATPVPSTVNHLRVEQTGAVTGTPSVLVDQAIAVP